MDKYKFMLMVLSLSLFLAPGTQAQLKAQSGTQKTNAPTITVTGLDVSDNNLKLRYEIRNESEQDVWILIGFEESGASVDLFLDKDDRTLLIRRRFDVPFSGGGIVPGRYVLLRTGETQTESVTLAVPVYMEDDFFVDRRIGKARGLGYATRLAIEISYYAGDLPMRIRHTLEEADRIGLKPKSDDDRKRYIYFKGSLYFNALNEVLRQRDEEVLLPYTYQWFKGEQVLRTVVEDVRIPYEEKRDLSERHPPDLTSCTRLEIQYQPSMLEYFFPYVGQQSLLSPTEKQELQSLRTIIMTDQERIKALAHDVNEGVHTSGIVRERSMAHVVCCHNGERLMSFHIYNDCSIVTEGRYRFTSDEGFPSLRKLTPQIEVFELRVQCGTNLRNLWHRFRLYYKASGKIEMLYPAPTEWCDSMTRAYKNRGVLDKYIGSPHKCPSAEEGKNHYAMNPNCKRDSPPDIVLLFETKAGCNQHGGPELFTFDNHDPKGGCVLLNDGTVKFIRNKEELQQLRWK